MLCIISDLDLRSQMDALDALASWRGPSAALSPAATGACADEKVTDGRLGFSFSSEPEATEERSDRAASGTLDGRSDQPAPSHSSAPEALGSGWLHLAASGDDEEAPTLQRSATAWAAAVARRLGPWNGAGGPVPSPAAD